MAAGDDHNAPHRKLAGEDKSIVIETALNNTPNFDYSLGIMIVDLQALPCINMVGIEYCYGT